MAHATAPSALLRAAARPRPALAWLQDTRERALERFLALGFPATQQEHWRYTDLHDAGELAARYLAQTPSADGNAPDMAVCTEDPPHGTLMLIDGIPVGETADIPGVRIHALSHSHAGTHARLAIRVGESGGNDWDALGALNTALLQDGLVIEVAEGAVIDSPIHILCSGRGGRMAQNRILLQLGAGSSATFIEQHSSAAEGLSNSITDIVCEAGAMLRYVKIQEEAPAAIHLAYQHVTLGEASRADLLHLDLGARLARNDLHVELNGSAAAVNAHGLFFADGERHLDNHTRVDHRAPHTVSRELYRGVLDDHGRGVFNGRVIVHPGACATDAQLRNQNLLLSSTAEVDTKPELEIHTDDVRCSHGATTGQLDPAAIFYLRSRGISIEQARRMLIASFVSEILHMAPAGKVAAHLTQLLGTRLPEISEVAAPS